MFRTKSKTEQARDAVAAKAESAASAASDATSSAHSAAADLKSRAADLKVKAAPHVESARDTARLYADQAAPKVQDARDTFVDEVVPKLATALATVIAGATAAKGAAVEAADRAPDAYHVLKGDAVAKQTGGGKTKGLLLLLLAAGAAAFAWKKSTEKKDPWATAGAYTPPGAGRDSSVGGHSAKGSSVGDKVTDLAAAAKEKAAAAGAAVKDKASDAKDKAAEAKDNAADKADDTNASDFGGEPTTESVAEGDAWSSAGDFADGSAPSVSGTSEGSDLSTPNIDKGHEQG
ncbi:hypothetical protein [Knoellia sp. Soil729]|uniref:hypothetical protein n=1 Tax=Knoellia sp. Soil729 TaxID=1736394 RepID=UPI0006F45522|nr:hypothetical protein [Knoellia sp. Soil729]KRE42821.1 hypothetical protein ASG74_10645 [Knoellia sp. Soil729]